MIKSIFRKKMEVGHSGLAGSKKWMKRSQSKKPLVKLVDASQNRSVKQPGMMGGEVLVVGFRDFIFSLWSVFFTFEICFLRSNRIFSLGHWSFLPEGLFSDCFLYSIVPGSLKFEAGLFPVF